LTDPLLLDVERLTFGFDALAHDGRRVVFVPYAAPGDRVSADVVERHAGWLRAEPRAVVRPGPDRVVPGCAWFPTCGGCQWQHVAPAAQRAAKAAIVAEQLARIAGMRDVEVLPALASSADWGYRARITLAVEGRRIGYRRARSHALVEIRDCPIADPAVSAHLAVAREWVAALRVPLERVTIAAAPGGVVLAATATRGPGPADLAASEALLARTATVRGTVLGGGGVRQTAGDPHVRLALAPGVDVDVPADAFTQVNLGANALLVATVVDFARAPARALDLFCGAGNFALPLARRGARVHGVERSAVAVDAARAAAARLALEHATFACDTVAHALATVSPGDADLVVLDPPRAGASEVIAPLARVRAPRIVYVSCDPATLARDARALAKHGYALVRVQPVDVFPQTYHIESVSEFRC